MHDDNTPDDELVRRWQAGRQREEVFAILQQRYAPELARTFQRMRFDEETSRDLVQDTLLQAFRALARFRQDSSFRTWLHQIARNAGLKRLRREQTQKRAGQGVPLAELDEDRPERADLRHAQVEDLDGPLSTLVAEEDRRRVRAAVDELPAADRSMVFFRIWQELSVRETAQVMNKPEGTIKSGWARIRKTLGEKLGPQFSDLPP